MSKPTERLSMEAERAEFERLMKDFERSHRLSLLLSFLGTHYFQGEVDQINEYNIATQVFGRSKTAFDSNEDSIVRVEAHRLRKRLKDFYENEGKDRTVQMSIPMGNYVPSFRGFDSGRTHPAAVEAGRPMEQTAAMPEPSPSPSIPPAKPPIPTDRWSFNKIPGVRSSRTYWVVGVSLVLLSLSLGWVVLSRNSRPGQSIKTGNTALGGKSSTQETTFQPIRILAGYTGKPQMDKSGQFWTADQYSVGGGDLNRSPHSLYRSSDPFIYEHWRNGDFHYRIPLPAGTYELHLYFVTDNNGESSDNTFAIRVNGDILRWNFNINNDALGANIADERIFRDISPDKDGFLDLGFASEQGMPALNAIEIVQGTPHAQLPIRMVMQSSPITDHNGTRWSPDNYFMNGRQSTQRYPLADSPDPDLFASERYGHFNYAIPVDTRDRYTLVLHFAELYFGSQTHGIETGKRLFRVMCNGVLILDDFDIFKEVGGIHELTKTFYHVKPSPQGKLNLTFEPILNNATVSGIEVLDEAK